MKGHDRQLTSQATYLFEQVICYYACFLKCLKKVKFASISKLLDYLNDDVKHCPRGQYLRMTRKQCQRMQARNEYIYAILFLNIQVIGNQKQTMAGVEIFLMLSRLLVC
jgi:hypothetical protein